MANGEKVSKATKWGIGVNRFHQIVVPAVVAIIAGLVGAGLYGRLFGTGTQGALDTGAIVTIVVGAFAIWLAIEFHKLSLQASSSTKDAAKDIGASVGKLEKMFDVLYSEMFSEVKETYRDIRAHVWSTQGQEESDEIAEEAEKRADEKISKVIDGFRADLVQILERQTAIHARVEQTAEDIEGIAERAIKETRKVEVEALSRTIRKRIVEALSMHADTIAPSRALLEVPADLFHEYLSKLGVGWRRAVEELGRLQEEGFATFDAPILPYHGMVYMRRDKLKQLRDTVIDE